MIWQEQQRTARAEDAFGESFRLLDQADYLTMTGMGRFAASATTPDERAALSEFYRQADAFYDRLTKERSTPPRVQALAYRRLGFTRMVSRAANKATQELAAEDYRRSIAIYERLLAAEPRDVELREGLADAYYNQGVSQVYLPNGIVQSEPSFRKAFAIEEGLAVEAKDPARLNDMAAHRLQFAAWLDQLQKPAEAERERRAVLDYFERLTAPVSPGDQSAGWAAILYLSLARLMADHNWTREQEQALRRGLAFMPNDTGLLYGLAHLLAFRKDADGRVLDEAVNLAKKATEVLPTRPEYWRVLARARFKSHDYPSATEAVEKAMKLPSQDGQTSGRLLMAMIRYTQGRRAEARDWYFQAQNQQLVRPDNDPDMPVYVGEAKELLKPVLVADHVAGEESR